MKLVVYSLILFLSWGCAVSSPQSEIAYSGEHISKVLIIPKSGITIRDEFKQQIESNEKAQQLTELIVGFEKVANAVAIKTAIELTNKVTTVEIAESEDYKISNYDFIVKSTGKRVPYTQNKNCDLFYFITALTLGIIPSVCSERHHYEAIVVVGAEKEKVKYEYVSKSVTGWFSYVLLNFEGWGEYYDEAIAEENFGHKIISAAQ